MEDVQLKMEASTQDFSENYAGDQWLYTDRLVIDVLSNHIAIELAPLNSRKLELYKAGKMYGDTVGFILTKEEAVVLAKFILSIVPNAG